MGAGRQMGVMQGRMQNQEDGKEPARMQREVFPEGSPHTQQDPRWDQTQNSRCCSTWSQREEQDGSAGSQTEGAGYPCRAPGRKKPLSGQQGHLQYILYIYYNCTSSRHLQLYSQPRERAHARQENTEVFLQSICSSWLPPRQETETVKEEDWNFSLMCWLVCGAAAVGSRVFGSRDPTGAAGLGLRPLGKSPAAGLGSDVLRGFPHIPAGLGGPAASLSFPWGDVGDGGCGAAAGIAGMVFGARGSGFVGMLGKLMSSTSPGSRRAGPFVSSSCHSRIRSCHPARGWHVRTSTPSVPLLTCSPHF